MLFSGALAQLSNPSIIPMPQNVDVKEGNIKLGGSLVFKTKHCAFKALVPLWQKQVNALLMLPDAKHTKVSLVFDPTITNDEGYGLIISSKGIEIRASQPEGCYYGIQSLSQMVCTALQSGKKELPLILINDEPRYKWRGLMLDESRHFFGKDQVKQILDQMALQKLNKFHWHLTDEPGWRIEIKQYPKLATVGGKGCFSNHDSDVRFYTQDDIKEIVRYAAERFIEVIPEVDMPGHASAANRAYSEYSGGGNEDHPEFTFHPGKESTYRYLTNILREVAALFPSRYIHIGGDEVHFGNDKWAADPDVQSLMNRKGLKNIKEVERYFLKRMSDSVAALHKTLIGWDEVTDAGLSPSNTIVMWWRHDKPELLKEAIDSSYQTIMCPRIPLYFDFVQHDSHREGRRWNGISSLDKVYSFPNEVATGGASYRSKNVLGIQANVWTEQIQTPKRLQFMIFPRLSALAESAWTNDEHKNYDDFLQRLKSMVPVYKQSGITWFDVFAPDSQQEVKGPAASN